MVSPNLPQICGSHSLQKTEIFPHPQAFPCLQQLLPLLQVLQAELLPGRLFVQLPPALLRAELHGDQLQSLLILQGNLRHRQVVVLEAKIRTDRP